VSISSKKEVCPYCKSDVSEFGMLVEKKYDRKAKGLEASFAKLKGTLAGLKM